MTPQPNTNNNNKKLDNFKTFLSNIDHSYLLDKNGKIDKYYKSFEKLKYNKNKGCCKNPDEYADVLFYQHEKMHIKIPDEPYIVSLPIKEKININVQINCINDIIQLTKMYPLDKTKEYNINMEALHNIVKPLTDLDNMIGMKNIKENIVDQILYYLQNLHKIIKEDKQIISNDYMHTVIYGPPGTGKTEVAKIIGKIYSNMGILGKNNFKKVTRSDLVAGFLGQTAIKTKDVIKESLGGVLFIDEAYSLGNNEKKDSFSKECIDTLCEALSDHKDNLMVIIAGYENELNECFFNYNQGLKSRFNWRFKVDNYTSNDLYNIFVKKIEDAGWSICTNEEGVKEIQPKWFEKNMVYFKYFGRDIENLFAKIKIMHSRRVFCKLQEEKTIITFEDLEKGFQTYLQNDEIKNRKNDDYKKSMMNFYV
jgi:SpoVK/Ycf46/Vps4 family AAA+-type ATPase